jgi:hypothetical protein
MPDSPATAGRPGTTGQYSRHLAVRPD